MTSQQIPADTCPACGRYVGAAGACPYCDTPLPRPPVTRVLRATSLLLTACGLAALLLMARCSDPPEVSLGEISPTMNFAVVSTRGILARTPTLSGSPGPVDYLAFDLRADERTLRVCAYDDIAKQIADGPNLPRPGQEVCVTGCLSLTAGRRPRLILRRPLDLQILSPSTEAP